MEFISPWIHTTERCNLKCSYCYVTGDETMPPKVYDQLERLLLAAPTNRRHLRFAGGEPTLVFNIWEDFARRMLKHDGTTAEVLTNLISPPTEFWKFAELDKVDISVSIDNDGSVKKLDKSMSEKLKRIRSPWIMTTLTSENMAGMETLAAFIGLNNYGWAITTDYFWKIVPGWEEIASVILRILTILKQFNYDFHKISFNNFSVNKNFSGCRAGNEMFGVYCDGNIYKCQTLFKTGKPLGNVWDGYTKDLSPRKILCKDCPINNFCSGWCPLHYHLPNPMCNVIKLFAETVIKETQNAK